MFATRTPSTHGGDSSTTIACRPRRAARCRELELSKAAVRARIAPRLNTGWTPGSKQSKANSSPEGVDSVQISISSRHGSLNEEMDGYIRDKLSKLSKIFERIESIAATVELRPEQTLVEVLVNCEHKHDLVA